ncbi:MAG: rod shape-determining protein MreC [Gallionella sp.]
MDHTQSFRFFNRGPSPVARLVFFSVLSLLLLFVDARYRYLESTRGALSVVLSPIRKLALLPGALWEQAGDFYVTQRRQQRILIEQQESQRQHQLDSAQLLQFESLQAENQQLRNMVDLPLRGAYSGQIVEIVYAERDVFKRRLLVNKGEDAHIRIGQVVMDETGIVGQVTRVYPGLAEVTLITEKDHAVPTEVVRTGLRTIVFGAGDTSRLSLRYMPTSADIEIDDILVTSGIDGLYPPGIPVARVISVERDPAYPFAHVYCLPIAGVDKHRHLMVLSDLPKLTERPDAEKAPVRGDKRNKARTNK